MSVSIASKLATGAKSEILNRYAKPYSEKMKSVSQPEPPNCILCERKSSGSVSIFLGDGRGAYAAELCDECQSEYSINIQNLNESIRDAWMKYQFAKANLDYFLDHWGKVLEASQSQNQGEIN